ncbi:MAG TPA: T9SS type A sorting domain-containing protein, partial [Bacteroidia bacterium]|nr:T9SS type A sorting domain-containing protein [Bacteroidia bacterium]
VFNYGNFNQVSMAAFDSVEAQLNGDYCSHFGLSAGLNPVILPSGSIAITPGDSLELSIPLLSGQSCLWTTGSSNSSIWVHNPGTYTVTVTNTNGCSGSASRTISNPNPLPVELVSFSALSATDYVQLEWTTASETYNDYFIVERSTDAFAWEIVGTVNGAGNSSTSLTYILIDSDPLPGTSYYRLKQVDFNGTVTESPVIVCHHLTPEPNNLTVKIIPNPSTGTDVTLLALGKIPDSGILILVTDNYGRQLFKTSSHQSAEKTSLIPLHFETALTPGVYLVTALTDQQASVTKLIVQ